MSIFVKKKWDITKYDDDYDQRVTVKWTLWCDTSLWYTLRGTSKPPLEIFYNISENIISNYLIFGRYNYQTFCNILLKISCEYLTETREKNTQKTDNPRITFSQIWVIFKTKIKSPFGVDYSLTPTFYWDNVISDGILDQSKPV